MRKTRAFGISKKSNDLIPSFARNRLPLELAAFQDGGQIFLQKETLFHEFLRRLLEFGYVFFL